MMWLLNVLPCFARDYKANVAARAIEAALPELLYRTSEWAPLVNSEGEPAMMALPEYDPDDRCLVPRTTGRTIVILHPDNLPHLRQAALGKFRLVEWLDQEAQSE